MAQGTSDKKPTRAIPEGFHSVTPYLIVNNAPKLLEFIKNAFGGEITFDLRDDQKKVIHATVKIGDSLVMVADTMGEMNQQTSMLYVYLDDVDATYKKAIGAGGKSTHEPTDEFYGDRAAAVSDEWGNMWWMATHVEDVGEAELKSRAKAEMERRKNQPAHA